MKLACQRCNRKKIKCDKAEGACHQCAMAHVECVYGERRPRPRTAQNRLGSLSRRLDMLETQLWGSQGAASRESRDQHHPVPSKRPAASEPEPVSGLSGARDDSDCRLERDSRRVSSRGDSAAFIYGLASHAKRTFEQANASRHARSVHAATTLGVDRAMRDLSDALEDLAKLKIRADPAESGCGALSISRETARDCVKAFLGTVAAILGPASSVGAFDLNILPVMPELVDSPHVQVDPAMRVLYYNALYFGLHRHAPGQAQAQAQAQAAYYKCLEAVPPWLQMARGTIADAYAACCTTWLAINNFDYQLAWKFHCQTCQFFKAAGILRLDVLPAQSRKEEDQRHALRYLYWHVLQTDFLFRMLYGKPSALPPSPETVNPPSIFTTANPQPDRPSTTLYAIWLRYTIMTKALFQLLDNRPSEDITQDIAREVEKYCSKLEELLIDWDLEALAKSPKESSTHTYLYADLAITVYTSIMGVKRMMRRPQEKQVGDSVTLRAARRIVDLILQFSSQPSAMASDAVGFAFIHFISFYPFCAVFALYEHIFTCNDSRDCETDVQALKNIEAAMERACEVHANFVPLSRIINSLNRVSKIIHENPHRTAEQADTMGEKYGPSPVTQWPISPAPTPSMVAEGATSAQPVQQEPMMSLEGVSALQPRIQEAQMPHLTGDEFKSPNTDLQGVLSSFRSDFEPLSLVRALEMDVMEKNWHDPWWEVGGDMPCDNSGFSNMHF